MVKRLTSDVHIGISMTKDKWLKKFRMPCGWDKETIAKWHTKVNLEEILDKEQEKNLRRDVWLTRIYVAFDGLWQGYFDAYWENGVEGKTFWWICNDWHWISKRVPDEKILRSPFQGITFKTPSRHLLNPGGETLRCTQNNSKDRKPPTRMPIGSTVGEVTDDKEGLK